ncbi:MAG: hypothetical protein B7X95_04305 [Methylophilaceae bacterium 17-44-8]|nr:MAG: hypothetical protein B7X95_04305 [Methylophilaceae bacterium 17-44-8]
MSFTFTAYQPAHADTWNRFNQSSRNGTFLFDRGYMDYHADRFTDASILIEKEGQLLAMLPASRDGSTVVSHGGLTFGGLILGDKSGAADVKAIFEQLKDWLMASGVTKFIYKPVPHIYHRMPSEEDLYALHRLGAKTTRVDVSTTIQQSARLPLAKGRKHAIGKAKKAGITVQKSEDFASFWQMLTHNLADRHAVKPTHSVEEMQLLASRFPQIQLFMAYLADQPVAGVVVYDYAQVTHTQYIGLTDVARETGALDALLEHLISDAFAHRPYFNFGISTCNRGLSFNEGLAAQKEMFGGRTSILQWLELELT